MCAECRRVRSPPTDSLLAEGEEKGDTHKEGLRDEETLAEPPRDSGSRPGAPRSAAGPSAAWSRKEIASSGLSACLRIFAASASVGVFELAC